MLTWSARRTWPEAFYGDKSLAVESWPAQRPQVDYDERIAEATELRLRVFLRGTSDVSRSVILSGTYVGVSAVKRAALAYVKSHRDQCLPKGFLL